MRHSRYLLFVGAVILAAASIVLAEDAKTDMPNPVRIQAEMHRAMADLIEARSAEKPDEAKIEKLADKVQALRSQMWAQRDTRDWQAGPRGPLYGRQCPWGGPRMGRGYGPGKGYYAHGRGRGMGRGMGYGMGRGMGGMGRGMGSGMATGMGRGLGRQWGYVDKNQDGICDNAQPPVPAKSAQPKK